MDQEYHALEGKEKADERVVNGSSLNEILIYDNIPTPLVIKTWENTTR